MSRHAICFQRFMSNKTQRQIWIQLCVFATGVPKVLWIPVELLVVCLYDFTVWLEGVPIYLLYDWPGGFGLFAFLWCAVFSVY